MTTSQTAVAVVTGGARGIGQACVRKFAALGHPVAILDVNRELGQALADELTAAGVQAKYYDCDVADAALVDSVAAQVQQDMGAAGVLVSSAALIPNTESVMDMDLVAHDRMWRVNYHGTVHVCRSFGRQINLLRPQSICDYISPAIFCGAAPFGALPHSRRAQTQSPAIGCFAGL